MSAQQSQVARKTDSVGERQTLLALKYASDSRAQSLFSPKTADITRHRPLLALKYASDSRIHRPFSLKTADITRHRPLLALKGREYGGAQSLISAPCHELGDDGLVFLANYRSYGDI